MGADGWRRIACGQGGSGGTVGGAGRGKTGQDGTESQVGHVDGVWTTLRTNAYPIGRAVVLMVEFPLTDSVR